MEKSQYIQIKKCADNIFSVKSKAKEISDYLSDNIEDIFSPVLMMNKFRITKNEIASFMFELEELGYIKIEFYLKCTSCEHKLSEKIILFRDIPEYFKCPVCGKNSSGLENAFIIFRVNNTF